MRHYPVKSQISIFFIIVISVLVLLVIILFSAEKKTDSKELIAYEDGFKEYIEGCMKIKATPLISYIGMQGGYFGIPDNFVSLPMEDFNTSLFIPYYIYQGNNSVVEDGRIEREIAFGLAQALEECMNTTSFSSLFFDINSTEILVSLNDDDISMTIRGTAAYNKGTAVKKQESYYVKAKTSILKMNSLARIITEEQLEHLDRICLTCLPEIIQGKNIDVSIKESESDDSHVVIYMMTNNLTGEQYNFAHKLSLSAVEDDQSSDVIKKLESTVGYPFTYQVPYSSPGAVFEDYTDLFDIDNSTGIIGFVPEYSQYGEHFFTIKVRNEDGILQEQLYVIDILSAGRKPIIDYIGTLDADVGIPCAYNVTAYSPDSLALRFMDDSRIFEIDASTGEIHLTPAPSDIGMNNFTITAIDEEGNIAKMAGTLRVT